MTAPPQVGGMPMSALMGAMGGGAQAPMGAGSPSPLMGAMGGMGGEMEPGIGQPNLLQILNDPNASQILQVLMQALQQNAGPQEGAQLSPILMALMGAQGAGPASAGSLPTAGGPAGY